MGMIEVTQQPVDMGRAAVLARAIERTLASGVPATAVEVEIALLMTYADVAEGVRKFPSASLEMRARLLVLRGAESLAGLVQRIGAMSDAELFADPLVAQAFGSTAGGPA